MTLSRAALAERARERERERRLRRTTRNPELFLMLLALVFFGTGLWLVYRAKAITAAAAINLNRITGPGDLTPVLASIPNAAGQEQIANSIYEGRRRGIRFDNVGALARLRGPNGEHILNSQELAALKPQVVVRTPQEFRQRLLIWSIAFVCAFFAVHLYWRLRRFTGDLTLLPIVFALSAIGLLLMLSLRDPLRDTLLFANFAQGAIAGCLAIAVFSTLDYERLFNRLSYVPLIAAFGLAIALGIFGRGPGGSDAKVNLFFFEPVELIRILLVMFLAGYFAQNWDALRQLRQTQGRWAQRFNLPRFDYVLPVAIAVVVSIVLFFWLNDLGPALILACLFLSLYSIARKEALLASAGLFIIVLAFAGGYLLGYPHTVAERVDMWRSPWNNHVRGGDQVADSLWALSSGGLTGTGLGLGDAQLIPAAHTDLIVSALGEELGFIGIAAAFALYSVLIWKCLKIALRARGTYSFFLGTGFALILALQLLLISGGLLDIVPLSGVVSPFLSYGRTSMVANCIIVAAILSISSREQGETQSRNFGVPMRALELVLAAACLIVIARAADVQVAQANQFVVKDALVMQADGVRRYQYNPRILELAGMVPKGTIYDRNGLPLATSNWSEVERHRADYQTLGVALNRNPNESRFYPFGAPFFYLLGDSRSRLKQGATNTAFQEKASRIRLQGFDDVAEVEEARDSKSGQVVFRIRRDYRSLIPLLRHRYEPDNPEVKEILNRPRDVHMSIDARLQVRTAELLKQRLLKLGREKGAIVVLDPSTGDLLASVSYPWPSQAQFSSLSTNTENALPDTDLIDRARFGLYPPGSSFKIVTAMAAVRKDPSLAQQRFNCIELPDGRVGNYVGKTEIRDDIQDKIPHGTVDMAKGIAVSCNAYFAQLGSERVGAQSLFDTASMLGISVAQPNTPQKLKQFLPMAAYGQGQVVASPFQMARVAAAVANGGQVLQGRWIIDQSNPRVRAPQQILTPDLASELGKFMRAVVISGTGRSLASSPIPIAGKTGTAELAKAPSHAWFIGYAPFGAKPGTKQIAFSILIENGQYGGTAAAPVAADIVKIAKELNLL